MRSVRAAFLTVIALTLGGVGCANTAPWWFNSAGIEPLPTLDSSESSSSELERPQGLVAYSGELRAIPLEWEPVLVGQVGGYWIERSSEREGPFELLATVQGRLNTRYIDRSSQPESDRAVDPAPDESTPFTLVNLHDGLTWFYRIRAISPSGAPAAAPSLVASATTAPPPDAPEELRAYSRQPRQVPLSWRPSSDRLVEGYRIFRSPSVAGPYELLAKLSGRYETTFVDTGLGDLRVFYYRVSATNQAGGLGPPTEPVLAVTKPEPLPPLNLQATEKRLGSNVLTWEPNVEPDILEYRLLRTRNPSEMPKIVATVSSEESWIQDRAVGAGEAVSYSIVAVDRDGLESMPAEPVDVVSVSYGLEVSSVDAGVQLRWDSGTGERFRGGHVFRHDLLGRRNLGFTTEDHFLDPEVQAGQQYRYSVVLERPDKTLAPPSQIVEVAWPTAVGAQ